MGRSMCFRNTPIDPISDGPEPATRLDVDIRSPGGDRVTNDQIGELDHRRRGYVILGDRLRAHLLDEFDGIFVNVAQASEQTLHSAPG